MSGDLPQLTERALAELAARREREAAALRANLRRRKEQRRPDPGVDPSRTRDGDGAAPENGVS